MENRRVDRSRTPDCFAEIENAFSSGKDVKVITTVLILCYCIDTVIKTALMFSCIYVVTNVLSMLTYILPWQVRSYWDIGNRILGFVL